MIVRTLSAAFLSLALAFPALAQTRYISDDLYVFMHSGPSNQFRIVGSVNAGTKINQVEFNQENKYAKIVLENGREGWVEAKYLNRSPGLVAQLEQVKSQLEKAKLRLSSNSKTAAQPLPNKLSKLMPSNSKLNNFSLLTIN